jgi:hypothetical protein
MKRLRVDDRFITGELVAWINRHPPADFVSLTQLELLAPASDEQFTELCKMHGRRLVEVTLGAYHIFCTSIPSQCDEALTSLDLYLISQIQIEKFGKLPITQNAPPPLRRLSFLSP